MFGLSVVSNIPQVTIGPRSTATGVIIGSTSKTCIYCESDARNLLCDTQLQESNLPDEVILEMRHRAL